MRVTAILFAALLLGAPLGAQASLNLVGLASLTNEEAYLINVNFGGTPQSVQITLEIAALLGTSGLAATLTDYDRLAAEGRLNAEAAGTDAGTAPITLMLTTPMYSGVHQFKVSVRPATLTGVSPFAGTLTAALPAGSITQAGHVSAGIDVEPIQLLFDREVRYGALQPAAGVAIERDFEVDFGANARSATFFAEGASLGPGQLVIAEILPGGALSPFPALSGAVTLLAGANFTTTARSGKVRFRATLTPALPAPSGWRCVFGANESVKGTPPPAPPAPPPDGGDDDSPGCTAGAGAAWPLAIAVALARRRRKMAR